MLWSLGYCPLTWFDADDVAGWEANSCVQLGAGGEAGPGHPGDHVLRLHGGDKCRAHGYCGEEKGVGEAEGGG